MSTGGNLESAVVKPSFVCEEVIDLAGDKQGNIVIEFDQVSVTVSFETLGLLYAMICAVEAANDD
jgi:hypothetical protein